MPPPRGEASTSEGATATLNSVGSTATEQQVQPTTQHNSSADNSSLNSTAVAPLHSTTDHPVDDRTAEQGIVDNDDNAHSNYASPASGQINPAPSTGEQEFAIDRVVKHGTVDGQIVYGTRWYGYTSTDDTWETAERLPSHFVVRYWKRVKSAVARKRKASARR